MGRARWMTALAGAVLAGCAVLAPEVTRDISEPAASYALAPPGADPSLCYGRDVTPARIETTTERVEVAPSVFETRIQRRVTRERDEVVFETPCPPALTQEFVASLQRALKARSLYAGRITGRMDGATRRAVRAYQSERGLDSAVLSMRSAREMGLTITKLDDEGAPDTDAPLLPPERG